MIIRGLKRQEAMAFSPSPPAVSTYNAKLYITPYLPLFTTFVVEALVASIAVPGVPSLMKNLALV